jgi:hypothetical protein
VGRGQTRADRALRAAVAAYSIHEPVFTLSMTVFDTYAPLLSARSRAMGELHFSLTAPAHDFVTDLVEGYETWRPQTQQSGMLPVHELENS